MEIVYCSIQGSLRLCVLVWASHGMQITSREHNPPCHDIPLTCAFVCSGMCYTSAMSKERNAQKGIDFEVETFLGLHRMHKMPVCPRGAAHTLTTAQCSAPADTFSLLSAPGQISQTNIFQSQENSHTSILWNRLLAHSFESADKADWISINKTIQFPCQYFTLHPHSLFWIKTWY